MENKQKIAAIAASLHNKPNKGALFDIVEKLIASGEMEDNDLAILYRFFMPTVGRIKNPFHWLVKAHGNKDVRFYLNHVYSDGARLLSTDGHRLHVINEVKPAGWYDDNKVLVHEPSWAKYPDIEKIMPTGNREEIKLSEIEINVLDEKTTVYLMSNEAGMNKKYVDEACALSDDHTIIFFPERRMLKVAYDNGFALVMGMRR